MVSHIICVCIYILVVERFNSLPYSLLCHILSFLTTEQAVATTTLSKRWKSLWTVVPVLDFQYIERQNLKVLNQYHSNDVTFIQFVCRVFTFHKPVPPKKFSLQVHNKHVLHQIHAHVLTWISYAIEHGLEELELCLSLTTPLQLPNSIFSCTSLKALVLTGKILVNFPLESFHFPNLKCFGIKDYSDCICKLLQALPNVQILRLHFTKVLSLIKYLFRLF